MSHGTRALRLLIALALCAPTAARAQARDSSQDDAEADSAALVIARADSARVALVQPPGEKGVGFAHFVRAPFHVIGASVGLLAAIGYGSYQLLDEAGVVGAVRDVNAELERSDVHLRPDFIGSRSWPALVARWVGLDPLFLEAGASLRGYTLLRGGLAVGDTLRGAELAAARHDMKQLHFWGVGPESRAEDRSDYRLLRTSADLDAWLPLASHVRVQVGGGLEQNEIGPGRDAKRPDLQDVFSGPRFATGRDRFVRGGAEVDVDLTHLAAGDQVAGARLLGGWTLYRGVDDTASRFQTARGELRVHLPVSTRHALALRGTAAETFAEDGEVPFYHLHALGDDDGLRGFRSWRFRDRALAAATAEWRYRVWYHPGDLIYRLDGLAFVDHGAVAPRLSDLERDDFQTTPGLGLRFVREGRGLAEVFAAFGGDQSVRWSFQLGSTF